MTEIVRHSDQPLKIAVYQNSTYLSYLLAIGIIINLELRIDLDITVTVY